LFGEYATSRVRASRLKFGSILHSEFLQMTKADRFSSGRWTISKMLPSSNVADTVGIDRCFVGSVLLLWGGVVMGGCQFIEDITGLASLVMLLRIGRQGEGQRPENLPGAARFPV